jgi:hypothetical protein
VTQIPEDPAEGLGVETPSLWGPAAVISLLFALTLCIAFLIVVVAVVL